MDSVVYKRPLSTGTIVNIEIRKADGYVNGTLLGDSCGMLVTRYLRGKAKRVPMPPRASGPFDKLTDATSFRPMEAIELVAHQAHMLTGFAPCKTKLVEFVLSSPTVVQKSTPQKRVWVHPRIARHQAAWTSDACRDAVCGVLDRLEQRQEALRIAALPKPAALRTAGGRFARKIDTQPAPPTPQVQPAAQPAISMEVEEEAVRQAEPEPEQHSMNIEAEDVEGAEIEDTMDVDEHIPAKPTRPAGTLRSWLCTQPTQPQPLSSQPPQPTSNFLKSLKMANGTELVVELRDDGYMDATRFCESASEVDGKERLLGNYLRNDKTRAVLEDRAQIEGVPIGVNSRWQMDTWPRKGAADTTKLPLLQYLGAAANNERHVWVHPKVAIHFAAWCSPAFANWVVDTVFDYLSGNVTTADSKAAHSELQGRVAPLRSCTGQMVTSGPALYLAVVSNLKFKSLHIGTKNGPPPKDWATIGAFGMSEDFDRREHGKSRYGSIVFLDVFKCEFGREKAERELKKRLKKSGRQVIGKEFELTTKGENKTDTELFWFDGQEDYNAAIANPALEIVNKQPRSDALQILELQRDIAEANARQAASQAEQAASNAERDIAFFTFEGAKIASMQNV